MKEVAEISSRRQHINEHVQIKGWLRRRRSSGKIQFLFLRDSSRLHSGHRREVKRPRKRIPGSGLLKMESSVIVSGLVKAEERAQAESNFSWRISRLFRSPRKTSR